MDTPIMYHGTDLRMVSMSEQERINYKNKCFSLAEYLWPNFSECLNLGDFYQELKRVVSKKKGVSEWNNFWHAINCYSAYINKCQFYQYESGCIYLTNLKFRAEEYARKAFAGGELGMIAYRFQEMAAFIGINLNLQPNALQIALEEIRKMGNSTPQPVIFEIRDYHLDKLQFENGKPVPMSLLSSLNTGFGGSFRYCDQIELNPAAAIFI